MEIKKNPYDFLGLGFHSLALGKLHYFFNEFHGIADKCRTPLHRDFVRFRLSKLLRV
jgi:hypothetical protein